MTKIVESVRLDDSHRMILKMRTAELRMEKSNYIRFLIEKDNYGRYRKPNADEHTQWQENRSTIILSDTQTALLNALKREYGNNTLNKKKPKDLTEFCKKYEFDKRIAYADLELLVKKRILSYGSGKNDSNYVWTNEGVFILPEYAFKAPTNCPILSGDIASLMAKMFGNYWDSVRFIQEALKMTKKQANNAFKIVLGEHILFLTWLREHAFDMTGIAKPTDVIYYRKQMMAFLISYCLNVRDPDFIETDDEFRNLCDDLIRRLSNYFRSQSR